MLSTDDQSITARIKAHIAELETQAPDEVAARFDEEQAALLAAGLPDGIATPGTPMPDGKLLDVHGAPTTLEGAREGAAAVVVFYRGAWCPCCNVALRAYEHELVPALRERGIAFVAISPQKPDGALTMQEANELTYTVLSDPGNQIAGQLGILTAPSEGARANHAWMGVDVPGSNGDGTYTIPFPTAVLVDADGTIRWIDVHVDYTTRAEPEEIIAAARKHV
jgi:peroxiredoxin